MNVEHQLLHDGATGNFRETAGNGGRPEKAHAGVRYVPEGHYALNPSDSRAEETYHAPARPGLVGKGR